MRCTRAISPDDRVGARDRDSSAEVVVVRRGGVGDLPTRSAHGIERPGAPDQAVEVDGTFETVRAGGPDDGVGA